MVGRGWTDETSSQVALVGVIWGALALCMSPIFGLVLMNAAHGGAFGVRWALAAPVALLGSALLGAPGWACGFAARRYAREERFPAERRATAARRTGVIASSVSAFVAVLYWLFI